MDPPRRGRVPLSPQAIVLGWDSATFDVVDPLMAAGRLPVLEHLCGRGWKAPLRSVWPPMTDCAWTSAFTGRNPGQHGIFGSWYRAPGAYACRYFSGRDRLAPALWELADDARFVVWNVPMTYPPEEVTGVMVGGYGAPPGASFCRPPEIQNELAHRWPLEDLLDRAPHGSLVSFANDLVRGVGSQADALVWLTRETDPDCVVAVWPHIDRAQHFLWRYRGSAHVLSDAIDDVYAAADRATGKIVEAFPDADVFIVSDHGAGPLRGDVNIGTWFAARGYAVHARHPQSTRLADLAFALPPRVRKVAKRMAPRVARKAVGASLTGQLGPFDWDQTHAFVGFHGDLWLNLTGREPRGMVDPDRASEFIAEIADGLREIVDPRTGEAVVTDVHPREEIYSGQATHLAPDAIVDSWSSGYRIAPRRSAGGDVVIDPLALAGVREPWTADHRPVGMLVAAGPRIAHGSGDELSLCDVCPTMLALLGERVPSDLDGRAANEMFEPSWRAANPVRPGPGGARRAEPNAGYSDDEAAAVAEHLKDLGYIE